MIWAQHSWCLEPSSDEAIVYPQFLEGRSDSGARVLKLNDELTLHLEQRSAFDNHLLIRTMGEDNTVIERLVDTAEINNKLFQDQHHMASAVISEEDGLHVNGIIGDELRIRPLLTMERTAEGHVPHLLHRAETLRSEAVTHDYVFMPRSDDDSQQHDRILIEGRSITAIKPEVHVVMDAVYYKLFNYKDSDIIAYYGAVLNSINLRYETIPDPKVTIKITGFTFNKDAADDKYISTFGIYGPHGVTDMQTTLAKFTSTYRAEHYGFFHKTDILVLVTGRDMCTMNGRSLSCGTAGLAYISGACTYYRTAVVEDKPWSYDSVRYMAHELAHNLGCVHDGNGPDGSVENHPGAEACPWGDGYIMSYVQNSTNEFHFSECCARQIKHVANLPTRGCLRTNNTGYARPATEYLPGTNISLDELCRRSFPYVTPRFIFDTNKPRVGCKVPCRSPASVGWRYRTGLAAGLDGTPCGADNDMICIRGECVPHPAPKKKEEEKKKKANTEKTNNLKAPKKSRTTPTTTTATTRATLSTPRSRVLTWYSNGKRYQVTIPG
ncbi:venom metalloproteinase antarease TserMP_A-like [Ornithodoros turicata]|uniref:venom metalloproteinase antarease TserMP_A-like n=1 Tax=Ornithodoros turicata TaxID=34597 RepID=UPI003139B824